MVNKKESLSDRMPTITTISLALNIVFIFLGLLIGLSISVEQNMVKTYNTYSHDLTEDITFLQEAIQKNNIKQVYYTHANMLETWEEFKPFIEENNAGLAFYNFSTTELILTIDEYNNAIEEYIGMMEEIQNGTI